MSTPSTALSGWFRWSRLSASASQVEVWWLDGDFHLPTLRYSVVTLLDDQSELVDGDQPDAATLTELLEALRYDLRLARPNWRRWSRPGDALDARITAWRQTDRAAA